MAALCERSLLPAIPLDLNMLHASERGPRGDGRSTTWESTVSNGPGGG